MMKKILLDIEIPAEDSLTDIVGISKQELAEFTLKEIEELRDELVYNKQQAVNYVTSYFDKVIAEVTDVIIVKQKYNNIINELNNLSKEQLNEILNVIKK